MWKPGKESDEKRKGEGRKQISGGKNATSLVKKMGVRRGMKGRQSNFAYFALNSSPPKAAATAVFSLEEARNLHIIPQIYAPRHGFI